MANTSSKTIDDLLAIMAALRDPETGCPWDVEQSFRTIAPYTIEEAYEVADAIERNDLDDLKSELGDLLLQVVFHAQMAKEAGHFDFNDVVTAISDKMVRRHPHVFGDKDRGSSEEVRETWEAIKEAERGDQTSPHILDQVPANLPGLMQAVKLQKKAARVGFDWPLTQNVIDKIHEEWGELTEELERPTPDPHAIFEEFGDLLFVYTNLARHLEIDPEAAMRAANQKFRRRFGRVEEFLQDQHKVPSQSTLEEMDQLWDQAKLEEQKQR